MPTVNTSLMSLYLDRLGQHAGPNRHLVLVLDQAGWHVAKDLRVPANITLLFLPPYSPELNPMERIWCFLKEHYLSNRVYADYDALVTSGTDAWNRLTPARIQSVCRTTWVERKE